MSDTIRVLVVGCGNMGASHARAYHTLDGFEIIGVVSRGPETRGKLSSELGGLEQFDNFYTALDATKPDAVSISTLPDTHAEFALKSLESGSACIRRETYRANRRTSRIGETDGSEARQKSGSGIYSEAASLVDAIHREGTDTRKTACHAHEPQSAKYGGRVGVAQALDGQFLAYRRLRCTLRRCYVPNDRSATGESTCHRR